jgi:hypothetical protein
MTRTIDRTSASAKRTQQCPQLVLVERKLCALRETGERRLEFGNGASVCDSPGVHDAVPRLARFAESKHVGPD